MRQKVKKEEESRRQYQDIARKKDEEIKSVKAELSEHEKKLADEAAARQRDKTLLATKDNKIRMLEQKLSAPGGGAEQRPDTQPKLQSAMKSTQKSSTTGTTGFKSNSRQKEVGRITKNGDDAERQVIDSIKKRPVKFADDTPPQASTRMVSVN